MLTKMINNNMFVRKLILLLIVNVICLHNVFATTYYVSTVGSDENSGTSELNAFRNIQKAIDMAGPGDDVIVPPAGSCGKAEDRMEGREEGVECVDWFFCTKKLDEATIMKKILRD